MKNRKLLLIVSLVLALTMSLGGTLAYLQDSDADVNTMVLGNVQIVQNEHQRVKGENGYETKKIDDVTSYVLEVYENDKPLLPTTELDKNGQPYNYGAGGWDATTVRMTQIGSYGGMQVFESENAADKFVTVTNTGKTDAYVRTFVAVEAGETDGSLVGTSYHGTWTKNDIGLVKIEGNNYHVVEYVYAGAKNNDGSWLRHDNGVLPAGDTTYPSLSQVYLKAIANNDDMVKLDGNENGKLDILVLSQAIQANGFDDAATALNAGFPYGEDKNATIETWFKETGIASPSDREDGWPSNDTPVIADVTVANQDDLAKALADGYTKIKLAEGSYTFPASAFTGDEVLVCEDGVVFAGTSGLNINGATVIGATFDNPAGSAAKDTTVNGIFKNCTFSGVNGLRSGYAGETVVFENCVFTGSTYGAHFDSGANDVLFKNCTFSGFNTMGAALTKLTMDGCTFKANGVSGYNGINLWGDTDMVDCTFVFDGTAGTEWVDVVHEGKTCTFTNCKVNDGKVVRALTAEDVGDYGTDNTITIK